MAYGKLREGKRVWDAVKGLDVKAEDWKELQDQIVQTNDPVTLHLLHDSSTNGNTAGAWNDWQIYTNNSAPARCIEVDGAVCMVPVIVPAGTRINAVRVIISGTTGCSGGAGCSMYYGTVGLITQTINITPPPPATPWDTGGTVWANAVTYEADASTDPGLMPFTVADDQYVFIACIAPTNLNPGKSAFIWDVAVDVQFNNDLLYGYAEGAFYWLVKREILVAQVATVSEHITAPVPYKLLWGHGADSSGVGTSGLVAHVKPAPYPTAGVYNTEFGVYDAEALIELEMIGIANNKLVGYFPDMLPLCVNLTRLDLSNNKLHGAVPALTDLTALTEIEIDSNQLTGSIPSLAGAGANVTLANFNSNRFSGTIPILVANTALTDYRCAFNQISGSIPSLTANVALETFWCAYNQLTGSIPSLTANVALTTFWCYDNQISGYIPSLAANVALVNFSCSNNKITGSIPSLTTNVALETFSCDHNQITGSIPSLAANVALTLFNCSINQLTGSVPSLTTNVALVNFQCDNNQLTGFTDVAIPATLKQFRASYNSLTQTAVDAILTRFTAAAAGLPDYGVLLLDGGQNHYPTAATLAAAKAALEPKGWTIRTTVETAVPFLWNFTQNITTPQSTYIGLWLDQGKQFTYLWGDGIDVHNLNPGTGTDSYQSYTHIYNSVGPFSVSFSAVDAKSIRKIHKANYSGTGRTISGTIPASEIAKCTELYYFNVGWNSLTGSIPSFSTNTKLEEVVLTDNQFTGAIPSLTSNTILHTFTCEDNQLTGYTASTLAPTLVAFYASGNALSLAAVDQILTDFTAGAGGRPLVGEILIDGGTNAVPTPATKAACIAALPGWTITTN